MQIEGLSVRQRTWAHHRSKSGNCFHHIIAVRHRVFHRIDSVLEQGLDLVSLVVILKTLVEATVCSRKTMEVTVDFRQARGDLLSISRVAALS